MTISRTSGSKIRRVGLWRYPPCRISLRVAQMLRRCCWVLPGVDVDVDLWRIMTRSFKPIYAFWAEKGMLKGGLPKSLQRGGRKTAANKLGAAAAATGGRRGVLGATVGGGSKRRQAMLTSGGQGGDEDDIGELAEGLLLGQVGGGKRGGDHDWPCCMCPQYPICCAVAPECPICCVVAGLHRVPLPSRSGVRAGRWWRRGGPYRSPTPRRSSRVAMRRRPGSPSLLKISSSRVRETNGGRAGPALVCYSAVTLAAVTSTAVTPAAELLSGIKS